MIPPIVVFVSTAFLAAFFHSDNNYAQNQTEPLSPPFPRPGIYDFEKKVDKENPAAPADGFLDTSTRKAYRNKKYGFEVKYPDDWQVDLGDPPDEAALCFGPTKALRCLIQIRVSKTNLEFLGDEQILERREINVNGIKGEYFHYWMRERQELPRKAAVFRKDGANFILGAEEGTEEEKSLEIFDQLLSTFKFIN